MEKLIIALTIMGILNLSYLIWLTLTRGKKPTDQNDHGLPFVTKLWYNKYYRIGFWDKDDRKIVWLLTHGKEGWSDYLKEGQPTVIPLLLPANLTTEVVNSFRNIQQVKEFNDDIRLQQAKMFADYWLRHDIAKAKAKS